MFEVAVVLNPIFCEMSQAGILVGTEESIFLPSLQQQASTWYVSIDNRCQLHGLALMCVMCGSMQGLVLHVWCVWQYARLGVACVVCVAIRNAWCCHVWCVAGGTVTQQSSFWATDVRRAAWQTADSAHANPQGPRQVVTPP